MWNDVKVSGKAKKAASRDYTEIRTADLLLETSMKHHKKFLELSAGVVQPLIVGSWFAKLFKQLTFAEFIGDFSF